MFISIRYKIFATLLTAVIIVVLGMFFLIHWNFSRDFQNYANTLETQRIKSLAQDLQKAHADQKGWQFLQGNLQIWHQFLAASTPEGIQQFDPLDDVRAPRKRTDELRHSDQFSNSHENKRHEKKAHQTNRKGNRHLFEFRVVLLDGDKKLIIGPKVYPTDIKMIPLMQESKVIGYLGHISQENLLTRHQQQFIQQQRKSFAFISFLIAALAALIAFPVAGRMVRRINALARGTHSLAAGQYNTSLAEGPLDELGQLTQDFNNLAMTLGKNELLRRQWVADISHELRTPIAVLQGEIEALQDGVRELSLKAVASLHSEVLRLSRLIHDLFQLSMSDVGALTYRKEHIDLAVVLQQATDTFQDQLAEKHISLELDIQPENTGKRNIFGDPERLQQLLYNLLSNSLKYTDAGGKLHITYSVHDEAAEILFQDSGPGVPTGDFDRLFDRLFRVESSRNRASGGAGLGLAICKNIIEAHNGIIKAAPSPYGGVQIKISLPTQKNTKI